MNRTTVHSSLPIFEMYFIVDADDREKQNAQPFYRDVSIGQMFNSRSETRKKHRESE